MSGLNGASDRDVRDWILRSLSGRAGSWFTVYFAFLVCHIGQRGPAVDTKPYQNTARVDDRRTGARHARGGPRGHADGRAVAADGGPIDGRRVAVGNGLELVGGDARALHGTALGVGLDAAAAARVA